MKSNLFFILCFLLVFSAHPNLPEIKNLNNSDSIFRQLSQDIDNYYKQQATNNLTSPFLLYSYVTKDTDSIFSLASRFNLPYDSIASLNGIASAQALREGRRILIPNQPGIFIEAEPINALAQFISINRYFSLETSLQIRMPDIDLDGYFLRGERFNAIEQAFFLQILFNSPLKDYQISSHYGYRESPFTNRIHFHHGIDLVAPEGTGVQAVRAGIISEIGFDSILGNYIHIEHDKIYKTVYGHLKEIMVKKNQEVIGGHVIGTVGNTGLSTGPHLHFEIHREGQPISPQERIRQFE